MSIALDYTNRIDPAALKAADVSDVCRYLSWLYQWGGVTHDYPNPKIIQKPEYDELVAAGTGVTLNWEYDAHDWLGGAAAGKAHAAEAVKQAKALGYPAGKTIIGSADFDMTRAQWDAYGKAYALAFAAGIKAGGYRAGLYGPSDVLQWCADEVPDFTVFWQCMSTSFSQWRNAQPWPGAHLRQRDYLTVGGVQADYSDILLPDWGQHGKTTAGTPRREEDDDMHAMLTPGEMRVIDSPTNEGGLGWLKIKAAFGDARVRVAALMAAATDDHTPHGWAELGDQVDDGKGGKVTRVVAKDAGLHWWYGIDVTHNSFTIQNEGPGTIAVSIRPRRAYGA